MSGKKPSSKGAHRRRKAGRIQCHFIPSTHWDREWRYGAQRVRHMLVGMLDMLFDIFEKNPDFKYYHLDSQTLPLQDYLEIRPEREETVGKYVREGRLAIGPWFCLPDEFCVGGEFLIRNLLLGHRMGRRFGRVSKTGYSPFSWGQISQMPQVYKGFGIDVMSFYRGIDTTRAVHSEYIWEGPDGSRLIATRLGRKPRHNIWYIIQRRVYWDPADMEDRVVSWKRGRAPVRLVDAHHAGLDYHFAHPEFGYYDRRIEEFAKEAIRDQDEDWTQPHRFWSSGHDWSWPDTRETRIAADCDRGLGNVADVFLSTVEAFHDGIRENVRPDWPVLKGEMRHPATKQSSAILGGWILSARTYVKQDNFISERDLAGYAEPLAVFSSLLGAPYPGAFIDLAYNLLLQNQGHDSIGGCSRDIVHDDMLYRSRQSREISRCVTEQAMIDVAGAIDLSEWPPDEMALVAYNPLPFKRSAVVEAGIDIPDQWGCNGFDIVDADGRAFACQEVGVTSPHLQLTQVPVDAPNFVHGDRHNVRIQLTGLPGMGYRTYRVVPSGASRGRGRRTLRTGAASMRNEFIAVRINPNGTLNVRDLESGRVFKQLGYFRDSGEVGHPWYHVPPARDRVYTTLKEGARIRLVHDGELETAFEVVIDWSLPVGRAKDERSRSRRMRRYRVSSTVALHRGERWVEVVTRLDNNAEDHRLQVCFPTRLDADVVAAQGQFDVLERPFEKPDPALFTEPYQTEEPMNSFVDISDGKQGLALLNEGLKAYESEPDRDHTVRLTLLRCFPMRIFENDYSATDKGSQCPGQHSFRYGIMPHAGNWARGRTWQAAEAFNLQPVVCQLGVSQHGTQPLSRSILEIKPESIHLCGVKRSESGKGWIVRLFNPFSRSVKGRIRLNGGRSTPGGTRSPVEHVKSAYTLPKGPGRKWRAARIVSLEEKKEARLEIDGQGWVNFTIRKKKILTIEFVT